MHELRDSGRRGHAWAAGAAIAAVGLVAGFDLFSAKRHFGSRSDWPTVSPELRESGRKGAVAGPGHVVLQMPGLTPGDSVQLTLVSRPGLDPLQVTAVRGQGSPIRRTIGANPTTLHVPHGSGSEITLDVSADDGRPRPVYLFHLLEIVVVRDGGGPLILRWVPALVGLLVYLLCLRRMGWVDATPWALLGVAVAVASIDDPLATLATDGRWLWLCGLLGLAGGAKLMVERQWQALPKAVLGMGLCLLLATMAHLPGLNGPSYWEWPWRRLDWIQVFGVVMAASAPLFAARALHHRRAARVGFLLALIAVGVALSAVAAMAVQPTGLGLMGTVIEHENITSYYTDALVLAAEPAWIATYAERLPRFHLHSRTKPPGPVLFYVALIQALGSGSVTPFVAALLIALGAALSIPAVYLLARELGEAPRAAFDAASIMALSPSLLLFFPEFDQVFPLITCVLLMFWHRAVKGGLAAAAALGLVAFLANFFSYTFLTLGVAVLVIGARNPRRALMAAGLAGSVVFAAYLWLNAISGFEPVGTFRVAVANQVRISADLARRYLPALVNDPMDFALGVGWLSSLLALLTVVRSVRARERDDAVVLAVLQIVVVNATGLLRVEAARVWLFMAPLVAILAGRELARWKRGEATAAYVMMVLLCAALAQNMSFLIR